MAWRVVPALNALLDELNDVAPNRDKASDGSIGDTSHSASPSGHNPDETGRPEDTDADSVDEVRARDFDRDLRQPGLTMEMVAQYLVRECRAGRITWIKYIIFNRRIWTRSGGWVTQAYNGANDHAHHMHVSCRPDTASENTTRRVGLASLVEEPEMDQATFNARMDTWILSRTDRDVQTGGIVGVRARLRAIVWQYVGGPLPDGVSTIGALNETRRDVAEIKAAIARLTAAGGSPDMAALLTAIDGKLDALQERIENDTRDAIGDGLEGGAAQVRADA